MSKRARTSAPSEAPAKRRRPLLRATYWGAGGLIWLAIFSALGLGYVAHDLPHLGTLPPPGRQQAVVVKDARGGTLATYGAIYGDWLAYEEIPEIMVLALLAVEDRRFFDHVGVDARGIARAALANLQAGQVRQGASTLTQQLAKNLFLSAERSWKRKAQEVLVALWLEQSFTKTELLELYLNRVYFGSGCYGLDAAARSYFGHSARRLSLSEAALLAGLLKAPSALSPARSPERAYARAGTVLGTMVEAGILTETAAARARAAPAPLALDALGGDVRYFTDWAMARARDLVDEREAPLVIYTSLDPQAQAAAERAVRQALRRANPDANVSQAALVAMSPDGAVKAMMGGASYAGSQFNRAVQAQRQSGSAFKPFVYLAALNDGLRPDSPIEDAPITVDGWQPENFGRRYAGQVTLSEALRRSLNTPAVRLQEQVGRDRVIALMGQMGIATPLAPHRSLVLGAEELPLIEMTGGYAVIANGGGRVEPYAILEIHSLAGELLYRRRPAPLDPVVAPDAARDLTAMLQRVVEDGTGTAARIDRPAAGKTGTSQDYRDALFIGFTADLVTGVWVGNDDNRPMTGVTGGTLPAKLWADFMIDAHLGRPVRPLLPGRS